MGRDALLDLNHLRGKKVVCLTLDVEYDHADLLAEPSSEGLRRIPDLASFLRERGIPLTCFVQGAILDSRPSDIEPLQALQVEFGLHSYSHRIARGPDFAADLQKGKEAYRKFFGRDPIGHRAPLGVIGEDEFGTLHVMGFKYDSSIVPSARPGVFNNLAKPTKPYLLARHDIVEFPVAVLSRTIRIPLSLGYIKTLGAPWFRLIKACPLPQLAVIGCHLHDLFALSSSRRIEAGRYSLLNRMAFHRAYRSRLDGLRMLDELTRVLRNRGYQFLRLGDVYRAARRGSAPELDGPGSRLEVNSRS